MAKLCLYKLSIDFWGTGDWPSNCLICVSDWPEWPGWLDLLSHSPKHQPSHHHSHIHSFTHRQMGSANMKCTVSWQLIIITSTLCLGELSLSFFFSCNSFPQLLINHSGTSDLSSDGTRECRMVCITMRRSSGMFKHSSLQKMTYKRLKWLIVIYLIHRHQINQNVPKNTVLWEIYWKQFWLN